MAVVVVLMVTLALAVMAHAALLLTATEWVVGRSDAGRIESAREAAAALARFETALDSLPVEGLFPAGPWRVEALRLSPELVLARSGGDGRDGVGARARILWSANAAVRLASRTAWLQVSAGAALAPGAVLEGAATPGACPPGVGASPSLPLWAPPDPRRPHPALGPVPVTALRSRLPAAPGPGVLMDSTVVLASEGDLSLSGQGVGVVVAEGTVILEAGSRLTGWVWTGGDLVLLGSAVFTGMADLGGTLTVEDGAEVRADPCSALAGLARAPALGRPWGIGPLAWPAR